MVPALGAVPGAYTLLGETPVPSNGLTVTRNAGANIFLPSENEWYKAAYWDPGTQSYFAYPARSNTQTVCAAPGATPNTANCNNAAGGVTDVGAYTGSASPNGTFDQGGNVWEWNEEIVGGSNRGIGGGSWDFGASSLAAASRDRERASLPGRPHSGRSRFPVMPVPARVEEVLRACLRDAPREVVCAWLFGSEGRGEARAASDVDVAVLYRTPPASRLDAGPLDLEGRLERAAHRPVQLVVLNRAPADLIHRVLRDGRLLLDRDRAARIRFEVARRNEYFDLAPVRQRYRDPDRRAS